MKKFVMVLIVMIFVGLSFGPVSAKNGTGPAPNSGDGISDGPGMDFPPGPFGL